MGDDGLRDHRLERAVRRGEPHLRPPDEAARGSSLGKGGVAGCLWNGCLAVLVTALLMVIGAWAWLGAIGPAHYRSQARADLRASVTESASRLRKSAADGTLLYREIDQDVTGAPYRPRAWVRRQGDTVTVTARITGVAPAVLFGDTEVGGCYEFRVRPPEVSVRQLSDKGCSGTPDETSQLSAGTAAHVVAALRSAYRRAGAEAAYDDPVWRSRGIELAMRDLDFPGGRLVVRAWLTTNEWPLGRDCYEFRAQAGSVTAEKLTPGPCYRPL
ncbi:hypothetical protein [Streptomyces sp. NPDC091217]|uniref:hypothetical protein n=1 Tax=Streptomyces sp. NPDC091217 TaxID=3365975 RepID=UPI0037F7588D